MSDQKANDHKPTKLLGALTILKPFVSFLQNHSKLIKQGYLESLLTFIMESIMILKDTKGFSLGQPRKFKMKRKRMSKHILYTYER